MSLKALLPLGLALLASGCSPKGLSFNAVPGEETFYQNPDSSYHQVDILWVVDNSGSMDPFQQNLAANFNSFMSNFITKGFDFHLAVTTSDSYLAGAKYHNDPSLARFTDGNATRKSGYSIIDSLTPNLLNNFILNATQGAQGAGDERVFQSMIESLASPLNKNFLRPGAFLAVVILSDEDDFSDDSRAEASWNSGGPEDHDYTNKSLWTTGQVLEKLDILTNATPGNRRYNVSAITVGDQQCLNTLKASSSTSASIMGTRYIDLVRKTNGVIGDICNPNYGRTLDVIQQKIAELSTQFPLDGTPIISSIQVWINNIAVPQNGSNGWSYVKKANALRFHGAFIPPAGAAIKVIFDREKL